LLLEKDNISGLIKSYHFKYFGKVTLSKVKGLTLILLSFFSLSDQKGDSLKKRSQDKNMSHPVVDRWAIEH
jgi:hypothetical protein